MRKIWVYISLATLMIIMCIVQTRVVVAADTSFNGTYEQVIGLFWEADNNSITFASSTKTFSGSVNMYEGYYKISGTYTSKSNQAICNITTGQYKGKSFKMTDINGNLLFEVDKKLTSIASGALFKNINNTTKTDVLPWESAYLATITAWKAKGDFQFSLYDIEEDGIPELFLSESRNQFYTAYTYKSGKVINIGEVRNQIYKSDVKNSIIACGGLGTGLGGSSIYTMKNGELVYGELIYHYECPQGQNPKFYINKQEVTESQYNLIEEKYKESANEIHNIICDKYVYIPTKTRLKDYVTSHNSAVANTEIKVMLNENKINFAQSPVSQGGIILVPLNTIFESMGASIKWNDKTKTATGRLNDKAISLTLGSDKALINGKPYYMDVPLKSIGGVTFVSLKIISESFGAYIEWDKNTNTSSIYTNVDANLISRVKAYTTDIPNNYNPIKNGSKAIETKEFKEYINTGLNFAEVTAYNTLTNSDVYVGYQFEQYAKKSSSVQNTIGLSKLVFNGDIGSYVTIQSPEKNRYKKMLISYMKDTADKKQVEYMASEWMSLASDIIDNINATALKNNVKSKVACDTIIANMKYFNNPEKTIDGMAERVSIIISQEAVLNKNNVFINPMEKLDSNAIKFLEDKYKAINKIANKLDKVSYVFELGTAGFSAYQNIVEIYGLTSTYDEYAYIFDLIEQKSDNATLKLAASELKQELNSKITTLCNETHKALGSAIVATEGFVKYTSLSSLSSKFLSGISSGVSLGLVIGALTSNIGLGTADMLDASTFTIGYAQIGELLKAELKSEKSTFKTAYYKSLYDASLSAKRFAIDYETLRQMRIAGEKSYLSMRSFDSALLKDALREWTDFEKVDKFCNESINKLQNITFKAQAEANANNKDEYIQKLNNIEEGLVDLKHLYSGPMQGMIEAASETYKRWDNALNDIYGVLKKQLSANEMNLLKVKQDKWIKYRVDTAKAVSLKYKGGTMEPLEYRLSLADSTKKRCYELVEIYMK